MGREAEVMLDNKICEHLAGEGHCCEGCHSGASGLTFTFSNSPVCCSAWAFLENRRELEEERKH